jgi:hypothetical protein
MTTTPNFSAIIQNSIKPKKPDNPIRTKPVRMSLDLAPMEHKALHEWCMHARSDLGIHDLPAAWVIRELLVVLHSDKSLTTRVRNGLVRRNKDR